MVAKVVYQAGEEMNRLVFAAVLSAALIGGVAKAGIVTECGASIGHEYFVPSPLVERKDSGWTKAAISKGQIILILDKDKPRLILKHAGGMSDTVSDGAIVHLLENSPGIVAIIVIWPGTAVENYIFSVDKDGIGELVWGTFRFSPIITKGSVLRAECRAPGR